MYGLVFEIVEEFVIEKQGLDVWHDIKAKAGCEVKDQAFLRRSYYPDNELVDLIVAASEVLGVAVPDILEVFGHYVVRHHYLNGYNDLMRAQGNTLRKWLSNLNAMHDHIQKSFPGKEFSAPIFWCEDCEDVDGSILLHYFSLRGVLLVPMCVGIIEELASFQFDLEVKMTQLALQGEDGAEFTTWRITAVNPSQTYKLSPPADELTVDFSKMEMPTKCPFSGTDLSADAGAGKCPHASKAALSSDQDKSEETASTASMVSTSPGGRPLNGITLTKMQSVFPFHVLVDHRFTIIQVGETLPALLDREAEEIVGMHIGEVLDITRPVLGSAWDWQSLKKLSDQNFFLAPATIASSTKKKVSMADTHIKFTGSMIVLDGYVMFALSPDARNVVELRNMGLTMTDLPLHGCQRDAVFLGEYIVQEVDKAHKLDKLSKKLENEKNLSNTLLYNMLPKHIADDLRRGKTVEPQHHENVSLFFSDIEGFTSICDKVDPWAVIDMLNQLYSVMDHLAAHFNLYKIETIGDAYMCCSGLPFPDEYHAENIANFAVAVLECVKHVKSPVDETPIRLRVGVHTGHCTAGVVGTLTPHYCLFGDMVNTTARHEQTGLAGKIQVSSDLYGRLKHFSTFEDEQFVLEPRGLVSMKGKAERATYWLEGGTTENEKGGPAAVQALSEEVRDMLEKKTWKMRRYFRRSGALRDVDAQSDTSGSTARTQTSETSGTSHDSQDRKVQEQALANDIRRESTFAHANISHQDLFSQDDIDSLSDADEGEEDEGFDGGSQTERNLDELDDMIADDQDPDDVVQNGLSKLVWDSSLSREDFVSNIHILLSPLLKLCLFDESTCQFPHTMDLLDGQLYGLIDYVSKSFKQNRFHNFRRTAHVVAWAIHLFERVQDSGAGMSGSVDNGAWFRFTLAMAALIQDCKHSGVSDEQLQAEKHMVHEMHGGSKCQVKYALNYVMDVFADEFSALYDEITWGFPRFLQLLRSTVLSSDVAGAFDEAMISSDDSPRALAARTEATMGLVLRMASLGHFALDFDNFIEWNEAAFAEKRIASLARRGNNPVPIWHEQCVLFLKNQVLPVVEQCETVLPKTERLHDTVALNLKNFEAQGKPWEDIQNFQPQSPCEGPEVNPAATVDVFC